jgi:putative transposase
MKIIPENQLKAEDVHRMLLETLQTHLSLKTEGYRCTTEQVLNVLVKAAAEGSSLDAVCSDQPSGVDGNTLREQLNAALQVPHLRQQEMEMNQALASAIPPAMPRGGLEVAIDSHDEPFYGKTPELLTYTRKAQAQDGTTHFFRIASAYVIWREVRLTLALTYVLPEDDLPGVVQRLLHRLAHLGLHATVLYLDKGFCSGAVIRHLEPVRQAAVLACPIRGKRGGIRALCQGRGSRITEYTFGDGTQARLALVETRVPDKTRRKRRKWLAFVRPFLWKGINLNWTPQQVYQKYRRRFGVECSYRLLRQVKVLTNSRNPALRFFLLGLGLVMQNVWVRLRWLCTRRPGKGRYKLIPTLLRFDRFRKLLIRAIELIFPPLRTVLVYALPNS